MSSTIKPIVYSANWCSDCTNLKTILEKENIEFENRDIQLVPQNAVDLKNEIGKEAVPYIRIGDHWLKGYGLNFTPKRLKLWLEIYSNDEHVQTLNKFIEKSKVWIKEGGDYALSRIHAEKKVDFKAQKDLVTEVDHHLDKMFSDYVLPEFKGHSILSEELADRAGDSEWTWIIDPVDGTVNYSRGIPVWGVSMGLAFKGYPVASCIYLPSNQEIYTSILGKGSFCNGQAISVSKVGMPEHAIISNGDYNVGPEDEINELNKRVSQSMFNQASKFQRVKSFGSAVWEGSQVASGRLDSFVMGVSHPWDICGITSLVEEAGGKVTHANGDEFKIDDLCTAVFSNGILHEEILKTLVL